MILETFLLKNTNFLEKFKDTTEEETTTDAISYSITTIAIVVSIIVIGAIFYTGGAISLSVNYNNYVGTSSGLKIIYGILVFFFPSLYYPFYAWFLSPVKGQRVRTNNMLKI